MLVDGLADVARHVTGRHTSITVVFPIRAPASAVWHAALRYMWRPLNAILGWPSSTIRTRIRILS
jgi:hypothetical protein